MKRFILLVAGLLVWAGGAFGQFPDLPMQEIWRMDLDSSFTGAGTVWTEEGIPMLGIGSQSQALVIAEGELVHESQLIARYIYGCQRYFDGNDMLLFANGESREVGRPKYLYLLRGNDLRDVQSFKICTDSYSMEDGTREYHLAATIPFKEGVESDIADSLLMAINVQSIDRFGNVGAMAVIRTYNYQELEAPMEGGVRYDPKSNILEFRNSEGDLNSLVFAYKRRGSLSLHAIDRSLRQIGYGIIDDDTLSGDVQIGRLTKIKFSDTLTIIAIQYTSNEGGKLAFYRYPDLTEGPFERSTIRINRRARLSAVSISRDNEFGHRYLLNYFDDGHAFTVYDIDSGENNNSIYIFRLPYTLVSIDQFDSDQNAELLVYGGDQQKTLIALEILPLSVTSNHFIPFPSSLSLSAFPNPFNSSTTINYSLPSPGRYAIDVIDIQGRLVTRLSDGWREAGSYREVLNGAALPTGEYLIKLNGDRFTEHRGVTLLK